MAQHQRTSPVDGSTTWTGAYATQRDVTDAIERASKPMAAWQKLDASGRTAVCLRFAERLRFHCNAIARTISLETGKPLWESESEVQAAAAKVDHTIDAMRLRRSVWSDGAVGSESVIRYRPIGLMAVLGPFNLPLHLPGAHIVPALMMGNGVLFKPSEKAPGTGEWIQRAWEEAGLHRNVLQTLQGAAETALAIVGSPAIEGVCFTGSYRVGEAIHRQLVGRPACMLALEMGGNNPLIIDDVRDHQAALHVLIASCFITSGQRCTCARRLIVIDNDSNRRLIRLFADSIQRIRVGMPFDTPAPFMGPLISIEAAQEILDTESRMEEKGAIPLVRCQRLDRTRGLLTPAIWEQNGVPLDDCELFGPLVTVEYVDGFENAIVSANRTRYGLSAGLLSDSRDVFETFVNEVRAGILNWNCPTTGATGRLPFGGIGASGNHRSSGYFAIDYCSDPIASVQSSVLHLPKSVYPGTEAVFN
jgi:succinylglutamic semialdehyde dehydrogenase